MEKSIEQHRKSIKARLDEIKKSLKRFLEVIGDFNADRNQAKAKIVNELSTIVVKCDALNDLLVKQDLPPWVDTLRNYCDNYKVGFKTDYFGAINNLSQEILSFSWDTFMGSLKALDFDALFQEYKNEGRLPEALDEIISCLEEIIQLGEDDLKIKAINDIKTLLSSVQKAKFGSKTAVESVLVVIWDFFKNVFFDTNPALKGMGELVDAVRKIGQAISKADDEIHIIDKKVQDRTKGCLRSGEIKLIGYDFNGSIIKNDSSQKPLLGDGKIA